MDPQHFLFWPALGFAIYIGALGLFVRSKKGKAIRARNLAKAANQTKLASSGDEGARSKRRITNVTAMAVAGAAIGFAFGQLDDALIVIFVVVAGVLGLVFGIIASAIGEIAESKGRSYNAFFGLSMLISPIITGLIVSALAPVSKVDSKQAKTVAPDNDIASQIGKLNELRQIGALSDAEFDTKKKQLLDRI